MGHHRPGFLATCHLDTWDGKPDAVLVRGPLDYGKGAAADDELLAGFCHHLEADRHAFDERHNRLLGEAGAHPGRIHTIVATL
jgi:hypothetical protein